MVVTSNRKNSLSSSLYLPFLPAVAFVFDTHVMFTCTFPLRSPNSKKEHENVMIIVLLELECLSDLATRGLWFLYIERSWPSVRFRNYNFLSC